MLQYKSKAVLLLQFQQPDLNTAEFKSSNSPVQALQYVQVLQHRRLVYGYLRCLR